MRNQPIEEIERICAYCEHATLLAGETACVCDKRGVVRADGCCRRFRADLLKLRPHLPRLPEESDWTMDTFSIEP